MPTTPALPPGVSRDAGRYRAVLCRSAWRGPRGVEYAYAALSVFGLMALLWIPLMPDVVRGLVGGEPAAEGWAIVALCQGAALLFGIAGVVSLVTMARRWMPGRPVTILSITGEGLALHRDERPDLSVDWTGVIGASVLYDDHGGPHLRLSLGWPDGDGHVRIHLVDELLDCPGETQIWVVRTVQSWIMQVGERPEHSLSPPADAVTAPTFRNRDDDDILDRVVDAVPRGVNEATYRSAMIALVGVVAVAPAVALAVFFTQTVEVRMEILPLLGLVEIGAGWLLVIAAVVLSVLGLNTVPRRLTVDHRGLTLSGSHAVKPVELPWEGLLWSRIEELGAHGSLLRLTLDPVLAPDTVERDEFGRAVIEVGHGLPAEDLAWLEGELEERRRAATAPTSPIRQSTHPGGPVT
ncbi:MAG: hypothetical protein AB8H79_25860 [Myxococcota bacterium]